MENKEFLPFPEPTGQESAQLTTELTKMHEHLAWYTEDLARKDAESLLVCRYAHRLGFLVDVGRITLPGGSSFNTRSKASSDTE